jgi:hypothetical protein
MTREELQSGALASSPTDRRFWQEAGFITGADGDTLQRDYCVPLLYCAAHWPTLASGDLVDVRVILGEEPAPCESDFASESAERKSYVLEEEMP